MFVLLPGDPVDAEPRGHQLPARLRRVEGEVRRQGPGLLLPAQPLSAQHPRAARRDPPPPHLHGVPQQLPLAPGPHRRRIQLQEVNKNDDSKLRIITQRSEKIFKGIVKHFGSCSEILFYFFNSKITRGYFLFSQAKCSGFFRNRTAASFQT